MAGRFFGFGKKKPTNKQKSQTQSSADDSDDDEYIDSETSCPTEPPRVLIPNYPPPRPGSPRTLQKTNQPSQKPRTDYQDPWDSSKKQVPNGMSTASTYADPYDSKTSPISNSRAKSPNSNNVYSDPFDAKKAYIPKPKNAPPVQQRNIQTDYEDPFDSMVGIIEKMKNSNVNDNKNDSDDNESYDIPYEGQVGIPKNLLQTDNYDDPWDTKNKNKNNIDKTVHANKNIKSPTVDIVQLRKDDYKDPWDSKISSSLRSMDSDDTYSEPYDKGKTTVLDEKKHKPTVEDEEDDDEYDLPYEERVAIGIEKPDPTREVKPLSPTNKPNVVKPPVAKRPGIQNKPQAAKPVDDYDAPWEWNLQSVEKKVQNVEIEFDNRFSVGSKQQLKQPQVKPQPVKPSPVPPQKQQPAPKKISSAAINPVEKPLRRPSEPAEFSSKYQVDPTIPLANQGWFHGSIRRGEAESLLVNQPDSSYLIRNSESSKLDYSLSLRNKNETMHLKITCRKSDGKYILGGNSRPYATIPEMIHNYSMNKLNIRGAEHIKLEYPVFSEAMYFMVEPGS